MDAFDLYQPLFDHLNKEHGLILTISELDEIRNLVHHPVSLNDFATIFKKGFTVGYDEATDPNASGAYVWEARLPGEYARYLETFK